MDLTRNFPRSPIILFADVVMLGRTTDKARAFNAGTLGLYNYGVSCPMDKLVLNFLGIDDKLYATKVCELVSDAAIETWVRSTYVSQKSPDKVARWNAWLLTFPQRQSQAYDTMLEVRRALYPGRDDLTTFVDLLDYDEGRSVPYGGRNGSALRAPSAAD